MSSGTLKRMRLSEQTIQYIDAFAEQEGFTGARKNVVVEQIIKEHQDMKSKETSFITQEVASTVQKEMRQVLNKILLGTNNTDRNTQVLIELVNGMMVNENVSDIVTTDDMEAQPVRTAKACVHERIKHMQQHKATQKHKRRRVEE